MATDARRAILIGSGAGGLAAAAHLARDGFEVEVLEQSAQLGGYLNPFEREGFQFDPGLHSVGECRPGQLLHEALAGLGVDVGALFVELDPDAFDVYRFPELEVRRCSGLDAYRDRLADVFPYERQGLGRFFDAVRKFGRFERNVLGPPNGHSGAERLWSILDAPTYLRWSGRTFGELLHETLSDPRAHAVLAAASGAYGLPPSRAAASAGIELFLHFADGAFFPRGGGGALRDALLDAGRRHGARYRTEARVTHIEVRDGRATGVILEDGERLQADVIVSDADPVLTFGQLVPKDALPARLREKVRRTEPSLGTFSIYLGMRRDVTRHGLGRGNVWDHPSLDLEALYAPALQGRLPEQWALLLSPNATKDPTGSMAPPGGSTLEVVAFVPYAPFARWHGTAPDARPAEYHELKEKVADRVLDTVERRWPGLVGDVAVREVSTPLTNEHYTLAPRGGAYGPALTPAQSGRRRFSTRTPVGNLFLAGAGVLGDGVAPCLASGKMAARAAARSMAARRWWAPPVLRPSPA